jgi:hypothetical protein
MTGLSPRLRMISGPDPYPSYQINDASKSKKGLILAGLFYFPSTPFPSCFSVITASFSAGQVVLKESGGSLSFPKVDRTNSLAIRLGIVYSEPNCGGIELF